MAKKLYSFKAYITLNEGRDAHDFHDLLLHEVEKVCVHERGFLEGSVWTEVNDEETEE